MCSYVYLCVCVDSTCAIYMYIQYIRVSTHIPQWSLIARPVENVRVVHGYPCACVYMCVCYIYVYTYMYIQYLCIYMHIPQWSFIAQHVEYVCVVYVYMHVFICMCACLCVFHICVHTYIYRSSV